MEKKLEDFEITVLRHGAGDQDREASENISSFFTLSHGRRIVLDFWTTKCVKCPAAIEKLNEMAVEYPDVLFVSCVLNDKEVALDIISEIGWENMTHIYIEPHVKDLMKEKFTFTEVPFCLVIDSTNTVIGCGNPKNINLVDILRSPTQANNSPPPVPLATNLFTSDDF